VNNVFHENEFSHSGFSPLDQRGGSICNMLGVFKGAAKSKKYKSGKKLI
jgi:hypothetical protein